MIGALLAVLLLLPAAALAEVPDLRTLVEEVRGEHREDAARAREQAAALAADAAALEAEAEALRASVAALESREAELRGQLAAEREALGDLRARLTAQAGALDEVYTSARGTASRLADGLAGSVTAARAPGRQDFLQRLAGGAAVPDAEALERLWLVMVEEIAAAGEVARFPAEVVTPGGRRELRQVVTLGAFTAVSDGRYLIWREDLGALAEPEAQPGSRWLAPARALEEAGEGPVVAGVDPSRGVLLDLLGAVPGARERITQGGPVGYLIIALGVAGVLVALARLVSLAIAGRRMRRQLAAPERPVADNPLGRVLGIEPGAPDEPVEVLESRLDEAILREVPALERGRSLVRLLAAVAPLLGLLGTVTGMIETFQTISVFGTGDPKLMAGGISQALVTTMLGLAVAVPLLFLHALMASRSRALVAILDQQSAGILAARLEGDAAGGR